MSAASTLAFETPHPHPHPHACPCRTITLSSHTQHINHRSAALLSILQPFWFLSLVILSFHLTFYDPLFAACVPQILPTSGHQRRTIGITHPRPAIAIKYTQPGPRRSHVVTRTLLCEPDSYHSSIAADRVLRFNSPSLTSAGCTIFRC